MFRNLMKAAMFTNDYWDCNSTPTQGTQKFPSYFPLFTCGKLVQLKHCITMSVVLNLGTELPCAEATCVSDLPIC